MIKMIGFARVNKIPYLGICFGMQLAVIEFARNEIGWKDATTLEFVEQQKGEELMHDVITIMNDTNYKTLGGTMRLGEIQCNIKNKESLAYKVYKKETIFERHRHRFEVNLKARKYFENKGMYFGGVDKTETRLETVELDKKLHPFFFGTQFHPEYNTHLFTPSPPFFAFLLACSNNYNILDKLQPNENHEDKLDTYIEENNKLLENFNNESSWSSMIKISHESSFSLNG